MSIVESSVSRELEIRFIDAKAIVTDAKLNLGIAGYPSERQARHIQREAFRIFVEEKSETERMHMRLLHNKLNQVKSAIIIDNDVSDEFSSRTSYSSSTSSNNRSSGSMFNKLKGWRK